MNTELPSSIYEFMAWSWAQMQPLYQELIDQPLEAGSVTGWLKSWSTLREMVDEAYARLQLATTRDTADRAAEQRYVTFLEQVYPSIQAADQRLKEKLLASGLEPEGMQVPLLNMRTEAALFRTENLPLMTEEHKLGSVYNKIIGAQTVQWEGNEVTLTQLRSIRQTPDRPQRERGWRQAAARQLGDRQALNTLWGRLLQTRHQVATNAGFRSYRDFRWQQLLRFDYTPEDCHTFHQAIESVAVPAATRIYELHAQRLGVDRLRPWDLDLDLYPLHLPATRAYENSADLERKAAVIFRQVDPRLGEYYNILLAEGLLDLENRKNKAPGAFCTSFARARRAFVFANTVGLASDVRTLLHESGHAFHVFERSKLPYHHQWRTGMEFAEVASMSMELLAAPYLPASRGGFYTEAQALQERAEHLEKILLFWPYMAVVDAFQLWVYENPEVSLQPEACDAQWDQLWQRFIPGVDWSGLEDERCTGWQRKQHIFRSPFYYVEYGLAQLGAVQVWANALQDQPGAVAAYLRALSLGGTVSIPELYQAAGARFAFDAETLRNAVHLIEEAMK